MKKLMIMVLLAIFFLLGCGSDTSTNENSSDNEIEDGIEGIDDIPIYQSGAYTLLAWNDLGMHCIDGKDYSVFSILPPFNNLKAQLVLKDGLNNKHVTSDVLITYESAASLSNTINTSSVNKTNFWDFVYSLFLTLSDDDQGLTGNTTPSTNPAPLSFNTSYSWWEADGIPIVNYDDNGETNYYPMVKVVAKDLQGNLLASTQVVLPVSDEMDCSQCHTSNTHSDALPKDGWENNQDLLKDFKLNILKLHDDKHDISSYLEELQSNGYDYNPSLYQTSVQGTPILCATCHQSNALGTAGVTGVKPLTEALHSLHASVTLPGGIVTLDDDDNRDSCYACHPGATTECLRGAMGNAKNPDGSQTMQCQSCHGNMSAVGQTGRIGWMDEPSCQACHQNGQRYSESVIDNIGTERPILDSTYATNNNTPLVGTNLYRFSSGHGDMQCASCHGSPHAIYPSSHAEDNLQSIAIQGHKGTVSECRSCHTSMPWTANGGPHGMHSIGQVWVDGHEDIAEKGVQSCTNCHGDDYRGSFLSEVFSERTFSTEWGEKSFSAGHKVSCYDCHNGPYDD